MWVLKTDNNTLTWERISERKYIKLADRLIIYRYKKQCLCKRKKDIFNIQVRLRMTYIKFKDETAKFKEDFFGKSECFIDVYNVMTCTSQ